MNEKELLEQFKMIRDYWLLIVERQGKLDKETMEQVKSAVNGTIFSILCLFDGVADSPLHFTPIKLVSENGTIINPSDLELHDLWCKEIE